MGAPSRVCLVANPVSGTGKGLKVALRIRSVLAERGVESEIWRTEGPGHAGELAARAADRFAKIVACAGDGTFNEIVNGLPHFRTPLGLVPLGTANLLGRDLRLPRSPLRAAEMILGNKVRWLDLGIANGRRFLAVAGIGFDAEVTRELGKRHRGWFPMLDFVRPVRRVLKNYHAPDLRVTLDGEPVPETASFAVVCNVRNYAGLFSLTPRASPDDGFLNVCLLKGKGRRDLVRLFVNGLLHRPNHDPGTLERLAREVRVELAEPVPYQVDGEPAGTTPVTLTLQSRAIPMLIP